MRRSFLVSSVCLFVEMALAQPAGLASFDAVLQAYESGYSVRAVIHYAQCRLVVDSVEQKSPDAVGGMSLGTFEYFAAGAIRNPKGYLVSSETKLISHSRHGHVLNYVRMKIVEDGSVEINARYLNPVTYAVVMNETFHGAISAGSDDKGVRLFRE